MSIDENRTLLGEDKKQNETWEKVKNSVTHVAKHAHAPSEAAAIYQQWGGSDLLVLLGHAALKNISNDTNNSRGHLIKSGFADIGQAVIGFLLVLQAYSLSQTATTPSSSTTTPMYPSTTTEADLPTFPTEPPNDFLGLNYDELSFSNGTLTPEMINGLVTNSIGGLIKVLSGIANVNPSKLQKFIKIIDILRSGSVISNGIINFKNGNWQAGASHIASGVSSFVYGIWNTNNKVVKDESLIVILNEGKADENTSTYKLYEGLLSYNDAKELVKLYNDNPEKSLSIKNIDKPSEHFTKSGSNNKDSSDKLKQFLKYFVPENMIEIEGSNNLSVKEYNLIATFTIDAGRTLPNNNHQRIAIN